MSEEIKLRAVHDFGPKQARYKELVELKKCLTSQGLLTKTEINKYGETPKARILKELESLTGLTPREIPHIKKPKTSMNDDNKDVFFVDDCKHNRNLKILGLPIQYNQIIPWRKEISISHTDSSKKQIYKMRRTSVTYIKSAILNVLKLANTASRIKAVPILSQEEAMKTEFLKSVMRKTELMTDKELHNKNGKWDLEADNYALIVTFKRGDRMATIPPANIW